MTELFDDSTITQEIGELPALALASILGAPVPRDGHVPPMWHLAYLLDYPSQEDIGPDGHPWRGVFPVPPRPGMRRMFAGGRTWGKRLRIGADATRRSSVVSTTEKQGSTGSLTFITVRHEVFQAGELILTEERDLVYRDPIEVSALGSLEVGTRVPVASHERYVEVDATLLFRFSAATFNSHRIHYDRDYARTVEGYADLVVHGPLQAILMANQARRLAGSQGSADSYSFEFRLKSPNILGQGLVIGAVEESGGFRTHARDSAGRVTAEGTYS